MSNPQFESKDEFEAYLANTASRVGHEGSARQQKKLFYAIPIGILVVVMITFVPGFLSEWALEAAFGRDPEGSRARWEATIEESRLAMQRTREEGAQKQTELLDYMQKQREEQMRQWAEVQARANPYGH
ncbi:MAG: hypothetical protein AAF483_11540 [Planctomycetota bacterium]